MNTGMKFAVRMVCCAMLLAGCNGGGSNSVTSHPAPNPAGEWLITYTDSVNTRSTPQTDTRGTLLTVVDGVAYEESDSACDAGTIGPVSGNKISGVTTKTVNWSTYCTYQVTSNESITFTANSLSGTYSTDYAFVSGDCSPVPFPIPCQVQGTISGNRCDECAHCAH